MITYFPCYRDLAGDACGHSSLARGFYAVPGLFAGLSVNQLVSINLFQTRAAGRYFCTYFNGLKFAMPERDPKLSGKVKDNTIFIY